MPAPSPAHLGAFHRKQPDSPGLTQEQLQRAIRDKPAGAVFALLLRQSVKDGTLKRSGPHLRWPGTTRRCRAPRSRSGSA